MSKAKFAEPILETIEQLRVRKARPDLTRISHMVEKRHGLSPDEVQTSLAIMVADNLVVKVNYKGNISYRNPANWKRRKRDPTGTSDRKPAPVVRTKIPKKKPLKVKATKALVKTKRKRGRPPLKKKAVVKPVVETDEDTEEEVIDESTMQNAVDDDDDDVNDAMPESPEAGTTHKKAKSVDESVPDMSADEATSSRSSKSSVGRQKACIKYELVKVRKNSGRSGSNILGSTKGSDSESDNTACEDESLNDTNSNYVDDSRAESSSTPISSKKIKLVMTKKKKLKKSDSQDKQSYPPAKKARLEVSEKADDKMDSLSSEVESQDPRCDYCLRTAAGNRTDQPEELLICKDCQAKAHPSCMDYSDELAQRACRSPWQCIDCKTCNVCNDSGDADAMLFCDACDKGYHMNCHQPPIQVKPKGKWVCCQCVLELGVDGDHTGSGEHSQVNDDLPLDENISPADGGGASCLPTPNDSPVHFNEEVDESKMSCKLSLSVVLPLPRLATTLTAEVPDASNWSIVDVVTFLSDMGFIEQSEAFRDQEIDGRALLLMTRMDVLTGLSLKLGPALKIFVHIQRLQAKHSNNH